MPHDFAENLIAGVQKQLAELGWYHLRVDGLFGPGTSKAVIRFKTACGLRARDLVREITLTRLFAPDAPAAPVHADIALPGEPDWLTEARSLVDTREVPGAGNNPTIMQWADDLDQWYDGDATPWCGLFVAHCMAAGAPKEPQNFNRLGARAWGEHYGVAASEDDIPLGAVCSFWRTHPTNSWHGHVIIADGQSGDAIRGLGGNQDDTVSQKWFPRERLLNVRVPAGYDGPSAPRATTGVLSTNEA